LKQQTKANEGKVEKKCANPLISEYNEIRH
jgi:hypothetical protein